MGSRKKKETAVLERDILERDFGDDWVGEFEDAIQKMITGAVKG